MTRLALQEQIGVQATNSHYANFDPPPTSISQTTNRANGQRVEEEEEEVTGMGGASQSVGGGSVNGSNGRVGEVNNDGEDGLFL